MRKTNTILFIICGIILVSADAYTQDQDLLKLVGGNESAKKEYVKITFKSTRVIHGHSIEFLSPGTMDLRILHRFGQLDQGYKNFLDLTRLVCGWDLILEFCQTLW